MFHVSGFMFHESGQSLIETIVAIFVLTTGLAAGLALAVFAFGASSDIMERIVATGLAREGIEGVRRMRDSNWNSGTLTDCGGGQQCYATWLSGPPYNITGTTGGGLTYRMQFNPLSTTNKWTLISSGPLDDYRLYLQSGGGLAHTANSSPTSLFRKITIIFTQTSGDYTLTSPEVLVRSSVWWHGKGCAAITNLSNPSDTNCKIISEEIFTNWRNY